MHTRIPLLWFLTSCALGSAAILTEEFAEATIQVESSTEILDPSKADASNEPNFESNLEKSSSAASAVIYELADPEATLARSLRMDAQHGQMPFPPVGVHFERYFTDLLLDEKGQPGLYLIREFSRSGQLIHLERWNIFGGFERCLDVKWDVYDRVQEVIHYTSEREPSTRQLWSYDESGRVQTIVDSNAMGEEVLWKEFTRDAIGNLVVATSKTRNVYARWKHMRVEWDGNETRVFGSGDLDAEPVALDLLYLVRASESQRDEFFCSEGEPVWCVKSVALDEQGRDLRIWAFRSDGITRYTSSFVYGNTSDQEIEYQSQSFPLDPEDRSDLRWYRWDERGRLLDVDYLGGSNLIDASGRRQARLSRSHYVYDDDEQGRWWRRIDLERFDPEPLERTGNGETLIRTFEDWD